MGEGGSENEADSSFRTFEQTFFFEEKQGKMVEKREMNFGRSDGQTDGPSDPLSRVARDLKKTQSLVNPSSG